MALAATKEVDLRRDTDAAAVVVTGVVDRIYSYYGDDGEIYSDITLRVTGVLKQDAETPDTLTFTIPGGEVGDEGVLFTGVPQFVVDEPVLVFLEASDAGKMMASAKYEMDGRYLPEVKMRGVELVRKIGALLDESGRPSREWELRRALEFVGKSFNAGDATCYKLTGLKWRVSNVTYKLDATLPAGFATAIANAVGSYNNAGIPLRLSQNPFSGNVVSYGAIQGQGILAQTRVSYQPATSTLVSFGIVFNRAFGWSMTGEPTKFDVEGIGAHEFGHAVGLSHPDPAMCGDQTMWYSAYAGEVSKRTLEVGDVTGLLVLYGAAPAPTAPPPSAPPTPAPNLPPGAPPPTPVLDTLSTVGSLTTSTPIALNVTGSSFVTTTVGLQFVIKGAGCPTTGCVVDTRLLQNLTSTTARAIFTPTGGGTFTVRLRNTAVGAQSDATLKFNVAIAVRR